MSRPATVVPLLPRVPAAAETRPAGEPLQRLLELCAANIWPQLAASTQSSYRQTRALVEGLGPYPAPGDVALWVTWLRRRYPPPEGCTDSWTVHLHWHNLAAVYSVSKEWGWAAGVNPAAVLKLPKPTPRARAIVNVDELWPLILGACHDLRERTLLQAARDFGTRRSELLGLMPRDLVTLGEPWRMRIERQRLPRSWTTGKLKTKRGNRALPVTPELRAMLTELLALGAPQVWEGKGGQTLREVPFLFPYRPHELQDLRERCAAVAPAAFPRGDWLHALRHTFAGELERSGASLEEVSKQLGHTSTQSTDLVYVNMFARPVDAGPVERMLAARRAGVTAWGAPPGKEPSPPGAIDAASSGRKRTAAVDAAAVQECSAESGPTFRKESTPCSTPSQNESASSRSTKVTPERKRPGLSTTPQRALPGLAVQRVTTRPRRR